MRFVLATMGTDGDVLPFVLLADRLRRRGHSVTLCCNEEFESQARSRGLEFFPLIASGELENALSDPDFWHPWKSGMVAAAWGGKLIAGQYERLRELTASGETILVASMGVLAARVVHEAHGTPLASIVLQPGLLPSAYDPPRLPVGPRLPAWAPRWTKAAYFRAVDAAGDRLVGADLNRLRQSLGLPPVKRVFRWWMSPDRLLGLFPAWYAAPQPDWPRQLVLVGFPRLVSVQGEELEADLRDWLGAGPPPIAFTFGTGMMHAQRLFAEAAEACHLLGARGLLLTRRQSQLPPRLPAEVRGVAFAPFDLLFPHCRAVVHHGGVGTAAQALAAGAPQLVRPLAWDQQDNAMRLSRLGVGLALEGRRFRAKAIARVIERLDSAAVQRRCREAAAQFGAADPLDEAARVLEQAPASRAAP